MSYSGVSPTPTRYAVICVLHGRIFMTKEEYDKQMSFYNSRWFCPHCGAVSTFDDDTYDDN